MKARPLWACLLAAFIPVASAEDFLDRVDQTLTISLLHDQVRTRISGLLDLEYYHFPQPPPGLIRADGHDLFAPRLSLFLDAQAGPHIYFFAQARFDTGFDPTDMGAHVRLDEYALRITPWSDGRFNLQVGTFSTVVGAGSSAISPGIIRSSTRRCLTKRKPWSRIPRFPSRPRVFAPYLASTNMNSFPSSGDRSTPAGSRLLDGSRNSNTAWR